MTEGYLEAEMPGDFREQHMGTVGALVDGKDFATDTTRQQTAMTRAMRSDKISHSGARCNTWTTSAGLTFEHTALFMARATEGRLVALWSRALAKIPAGRAVLAGPGAALVEEAVRGALRVGCVGVLEPCARSGLSVLGIPPSVFAEAST